MGIFSSKQSLGCMTLNFTSKTVASISDEIPHKHGEIICPLWFAFLFAAKLLYNFPGDVGRQVVSRALSTLSSKVDTNNLLAYNQSMLGMCCLSPITIAENNLTGKWIYRGELLLKDDNLIVNTEVARGDEEHFHRAAIDLAFEATRIRLGSEGGIVCAAALMFFGALSQQGCRDISANMHFGAMAAGFATAELSQH